MKKFLFIFLCILLFSCLSPEKTGIDWEMDAYINMTLSQVIEILGDPKYINEKIIDNNYFSTPVEPPYNIFFTEEELINSIKITIVKWINGNREVIVYFKNIEDDLIVFTSINRRIRRSNVFIRYD